MSLSVAFVGTGNFGFPLAKKCLKDGLQVHVVMEMDRSTDAKNSLLNLGAQDVKIKDLKKLDLLALCLPRSSDVDEVMDSVSSFPPVIVDLSTVSPSDTIKRSKHLEQFNVLYIDAPVSGSIQSIENGELVVFCGTTRGRSPVFDKFIDVVSCHPIYLTHVGAGNKAKLVNQLIHLCNMSVIAEAIKVLKSQDLPVSELIEVYKKSSASSTMLTRFGQAICLGDLTPYFKLSLALKDMDLVDEISEKNGINLPVFQQCKLQYYATQSVYGNDVNFSAIAVKEIYDNDLKVS